MAGSAPKDELPKAASEAKDVKSSESLDEQSTPAKSKGEQGPGSAGHGSSSSKPNQTAQLTAQQAQQALALNPTLRAQFEGLPESTAVEKLRQMDVSQLLQGMALGGKSAKDMASYKFWSTQPVPRFDDNPQKVEPDGDIKQTKIEDVPKQPRPMISGFEWVTVDLEDKKELQEVHELLFNHYVEDDAGMFRLNYAAPFLNWALKSPGWKKDWHVGVRASKSRKLVAFISAVPCKLRVRGRLLDSAEVNFLVIHQKLRGHRLTPVLVEEITRQCNLKGVFQACYTAGILIPKPVSSCRYYHRSLNWAKLYECQFAGLPTGSTVARQVAKYRLPERTQLKGLREMTKKDVPAVTELLDRYLKQYVMAPEYTEEEILHWMVHDESSKEQVVWSYVVEEPGSKKITDFVSFYLLESTVLGQNQRTSIRAAYLYYYATDSAFSSDPEALKTRLQALSQDALILAKKAKFDVMNALTLLDNPLFLEQQKFQPGDGQLHYYLFNYRTAPIAGGVNENNFPDPTSMGGVGLVML